jgi:ACR3 family arsenite efflux pump ArsB
MARGNHLAAGAIAGSGLIPRYRFAREGSVGNVFSSLGWAALLFALYLIIALILSRLIAGIFRMTTEAGRTLAFNVSTRNSFVVLPLALALPSGWEATATVIVLQTLIELSGMIIYVWIIPKHIFPTN